MELEGVITACPVVPDVVVFLDNDKADSEGLEARGQDDASVQVSYMSSSTSKQSNVMSRRRHSRVPAPDNGHVCEYVGRVATYGA